jgi:hypothetical protein
MSRYFIIVLLGLSSADCWGGSISDQFAGGYNGVAWGTSLTNLVGMLPTGQHVFATTPGERLYMVPSAEPLLGVPRDGMAVEYGLDKDDRVSVVAVKFAYERRDQLLGALISQFGAFSGKGIKGTTTWYAWPNDRGLSMSVYVSTSPLFGILELVISRKTAVS